MTDRQMLEMLDDITPTVEGVARDASWDSDLHEVARALARMRRALRDRMPRKSGGKR